MSRLKLRRSSREVPSPARAAIRQAADVPQIKVGVSLDARVRIKKLDATQRVLAVSDRFDDIQPRSARLVDLPQLAVDGRASAGRNESGVLADVVHSIVRGRSNLTNKLLIFQVMRAALIAFQSSVNKDVHDVTH